MCPDYWWAHQRHHLFLLQCFFFQHFLFIPSWSFHLSACITHSCLVLTFPIRALNIFIIIANSDVWIVSSDCGSFPFGISCKFFEWYTWCFSNRNWGKRPLVWHFVFIWLSRLCFIFFCSCWCQRLQILLLSLFLSLGFWLPWVLLLKQSLSCRHFCCHPVFIWNPDGLCGPGEWFYNLMMKSQSFCEPVVLLLTFTSACPVLFLSLNKTGKLEGAGVGECPSQPPVKLW